MEIPVEITSILAQAGRRVLRAGALLSLLVQLCSGQRYPFQLYSADRGLSSLTVECMAQDGQGVLWVGTRNGLFRYNGERFEAFTEEQGLPSNVIRSMMVYDSRFWVATERGLAVWTGKSFEVPVAMEAFRSTGTIVVMAAAGTRLFLGAKTGLYEVQNAGPIGTELSVVRLHDAGPVESLHATHDGSLWFGGAGGLFRMEIASGRIRREGSELPSQSWGGIQTTRDGSVWVRSQTQLWRRPTGVARFQPSDYKVPNSDLYWGLFSTPAGGLAVPTPSGLLLWQDGVWRVLNEGNGLPSSFAAFAYWDHEHNLWAGLAATGVARELGHGLWRGWTTADGLPHAIVSPITRDKQENLWVGTQSGIARLPLDGQRGLILGVRDGLPDDVAHALVFDEHGYMWIGYKSSGMVRMPAGGGRPARFGRADGLGDSRVLSVQLDREGRLWVSTRAGLYVARTSPDRPRFEPFLPADVRDRTVFHTTISSDGALWAGSSQGLYRHHKGEWRGFTKKDGLLEDGVPYVAASRDGGIWIGYGISSGVAKVQYRDGKLELRNYSTKNSALRSGDLNFVEEDSRGWLWVGSDQGVDAFDGSTWRHFGVENGLVWADTNFNAFHDDGDGSVWIGTNRGLSQVRVTGPLPPLKAPGVWLLETRVHRNTREGEASRIPLTNRSFTVRFAPATFEDEGDAVCRFRLLGLGPEWTTTKEHLQTFSNLDPGDYTFEAQASINGIDWSAAPARISFHVRPVWWQKWWVRLAAVLGTLGAVVLLWRRRIHDHLKQQAALQRTIEERARLIVEQRHRIEAAKAGAERARKAASESDRRFRTLLEDVRLATLMFGRDGRVFFCNDYLLSLTGWSREDLTGKDWLEALIAPGARDALRTRFAEAAVHGSCPAHYECPVLTRGGQERIVHWNSTALHDEAGEVTGVASIGSDMTEQRLLEEAQRQTQKMESVGRLAGGVAHDFNNLLTVINGYGDLLLSRTDTTDPRRTQIEEIRKAGERAATLTQQLLAFSRKQVGEPRVLDINAVIADTETMFGRLLGEDIDLAIIPSPSLGRVMADPGQMHQILANLVVNARDAMPGGGRLLIETANVEIDGTPVAARGEVTPGSYVVITVADSGTGMDEETRKHIFEPFFTTKEVGKGTGLGLSTVYGIVRQSGGGISVDSEPGKGSTFRIYFPRIEAPVTREVRKTTAASSPCGGQTVLIVEDQDEVRRLAVEVLEEYGYRVLEADCGPAALPLAERYAGPIHALVTDVVMPRMTGPELAERLVSLRPGVKVLYISGYTDNVLAERMDFGPGTDFLGKPFNPDMLVSKLRDLLGPSPAL